MWHCPLCQHPLALANAEHQTKTWRCDNRHSFDEAKSGYLNLLPVQHKHSKQPGDDKTMLNARRCFHDGNGYLPLMQVIAEKIRKHSQLALLPEFNLYDAGCGEGSYLGVIQASLQAEDHRVMAWGSDIAKHAVDIAAKRFSHCHFAVASSARLPVADKSLHTVLQVFAPGHDSEYARVIASDGLCIMVDPGPDHLWEIKQAIYDSPRKHQDKMGDMPGFELLEKESLSFTIAFTSQAMRKALLEMTPYYWRLPIDKADELVNADFDVTADFVVRVFKRVA
ncbi:putative RNA methyltransferase [Alteromonas sp. AMM-1]|uniref:putative RNA methyltransferase n=1 Tax=Alteromonas sp. AMM-1 TaxID=3394233 RepID=UPI0039A5E77E